MVRGLTAESGLSRNQLLSPVFLVTVELVLRSFVVPGTLDWIALGVQVAPVYVLEACLYSIHLYNVIQIILIIVTQIRTIPYR